MDTVVPPTPHRSQTFDLRTMLFVELIGGIGDLIIAVPAIQSLAPTFPEAKLTVLAYGPGTALRQHDSYVARTVTVAAAMGEQAARIALVAVLRDGHYDLIVSDAISDGIDQATIAHGWEMGTERKLPLSRAVVPGEGVGG